jgi:hypothetical protein
MSKNDFFVFEYEIMFDEHAKSFKTLPTLLKAFCNSIKLPIRTVDNTHGVYRVLLPHAGQEVHDFAHATNALSSFVHFHQVGGRMVPGVSPGGYQTLRKLY